MKTSEWQISPVFPIDIDISSWKRGHSCLKGLIEDSSTVVLL